MENGTLSFFLGDLHHQFFSAQTGTYAPEAVINFQTKMLCGPGVRLFDKCGHLEVINCQLNIRRM